MASFQHDALFFADASLAVDRQEIGCRMNSVLVTGANGFVGRRLCAALIEAGHTVQATSRSSAPAHNAPHAVAFLPVGDIGPETEWAGALHGIEVIIHLAARVHVMREKAADAIERYRLVNVEGTRRLALMAARSGVRRFVYVSTVKVNGESTGEEPFRDNDIPSPQDAYAISKWEAEEALHVISSQTGLEIVIIRPPLVYGPGAKGNMLTLMRYVDHGYPLPFGGINNQRSFISLDNLADVLVTAANNAECA
jgi:UDP-glucose 4-epimerase